MGFLRAPLLLTLIFFFGGCADESPPGPVDSNNLDKKYVIYDFGAPWCPACQTFAPTFEEWKAKYSGSCVTFKSVNVDEDRSVATKYRIEALPTILVLADGKEVRRFVGEPRERDLTRLLK